MDEVQPDIYERVWPAGNADRSWTALRRRVARGKTAAAESGAGNHDCAEQPATRQGGGYGLRGKGRGMSNCECTNWATLNLRHQLLTGHHEWCPHSPSALTAAVELIAEMAHGMERWAADEDGIHPDAWKSYIQAKALEGVFLPEEPN